MSAPSASPRSESDGCARATMATSVPLVDVQRGVVGFAVPVALFPRWKRHGFALGGVVRDLRQKVADDVQSGALPLFESATCQGANSVLVAANISSRARE